MAKSKIKYTTTINLALDESRKKLIAECETRMVKHFEKSLKNPNYRKLHGMALSEN